MSNNFSSKSKKELVLKWKKEHQEIVASATKIIKAYEAGELNIIREEIEHLSDLTLEHLMAEDVAFYKLLMLGNSLDDELKELIENFIKTFEKTKPALIDFLTQHTFPDAVYDEKFIDDFKSIVDVLGERISYEEKTLYKMLQGE